MELRWRSTGERPDGFGGLVVAELMLGQQLVGQVERWRHRFRYLARMVDDVPAGHVRFKQAGPLWGCPSDPMGALMEAMKRELAGATRCECGHVQMPWSKWSATEQGWCNTCSHWRRQAARGLEDTDVIVDGEIYQINREFPRNGNDVRGFGGGEHLIVFDDGRQIYTTNLFSGGKIPEHLRTILPDTGRFWNIEEALKGRDRRATDIRQMCRCGALPFDHICWKEPLTPLAVIREIR